MLLQPQAALSYSRVDLEFHSVVPYFPYKLQLCPGLLLSSWSAFIPVQPLLAMGAIRVQVRASLPAFDASDSPV